VWLLPLSNVRTPHPLFFIFLLRQNAA
jgi:hypothetical protein